MGVSYVESQSGLNNISRLEDDVGFPAEIKVEPVDDCLQDDDKDIKICVVCGERASGYYFGALVCLPCKSFYIRCTKDGEPSFTCQCNEKPETVQPAEGQVLCKVCGDIANGIHFGVNTCEGCKKFFRRGLVENQSYICKGDKNCSINPRNRNTCRFCRYQKCIAEGMSREAIKMGRPKKTESTDNGSTQSPVHSPPSVEGLSDSNSQSGYSDSSLSPRPVVTYSPSSSSSYHHPSTSPDISLENEDSSVLLQCMLRSNKEFKTEEHLSSSCQHQTMNQNHGVSSPTSLTTVTSDVSFMTPSSPNDVCAQGSNTQTQSSYSSNQVWTNEGQMNWTRPSQPIPPMTQNGAENNVQFAEEDMDEILDYLQPEPSSRKGMYSSSACIKSRKSYHYSYMERQNAEYGYNQSQYSSSQPPCMMRHNLDYQYQQADHYASPSYQQPPALQDNGLKQLSVDTTQYQQSPAHSSSPYHNSPVYSSSPSHHSYPSSPESFADHPQSPCSMQGSPTHSMQYPHSPVGQSSPGYPSSPASDVSYPVQSNSPVQCNQYYGSSPIYGHLTLKSPIDDNNIY
ncbi:hypothetical protein KUTeg_014320 [Tegillarca granosa]|uniref:Nuclear receptor domain-containing protein n=1 Tax=Tegillarca granosa TaxID=220873 RepID=A0ABQ9EZT1_TEGGR|nr:hypothetical protein KUTeg_014320 [Tegillarca granosa]